MTFHLCKRLWFAVVGSSRKIGGLRRENAVVVRHISSTVMHKIEMQLIGKRKDNYFGDIFR
jgi:hypothetical protein